MPLSSQRQRFSIFVSPRNEDFLFYEKVDKQRVQESIPEYGDPHPDFRKYPNHFFTQSVQADEEGQTYFYYYAAKRDHQDDYNFEHSTVNHKSGTYDQVTRTYITLRSEYDEDSPALGSSMPIVDADPFDVSDQYTLISREQSRVGETVGISSKRNPDEMDSMFVLEKCVYLKRAPITTTAYDKQTGAHIFTTTNLVHRDETPEGSSLTVSGLIADSSNPFWDVDEETGSHKVIEQVSEEWYYVSSVQNGEANERRVFLYLTPNQNDFVFYELVDRRNEKLEPDPLPAFGDAHSEFTDHKFVAAVPNDNIGDFYKFYYARDRFNEDQYNFSESFVDIGGVRVSLVRRSYVVLRDAYDPTAPEVGASMPSGPDNKFTGGYLLVDRVQRPIEDETLSSLYVSEERVYAKTPEGGSQEGNFTLQEGGLTVTRTWIVPRDQVGAFPRPSIGSSDSEYGQYEYATRRISQDTPPEIDSYFSVVLDIYAKKGWAFQEDHQYNIGYKIIETSTLEDDKDGEGNYTVSFDERGWQRKQRSAELTGFEYESQVETRPYGKITTNTSAGTEPIVGQNNTRSRIVFDDGTLQIYQRDEDTFTIKEGSAGQEKNEQIYASITTNKFYRTSGDVLTETGSSRVIYDDGTTQVYEVSEEFVVAKEGGDAGQTKDEQIYATITTNSKFSSSSAVGTDTGRSRVVYRGGGVTIYQVDEETVVAKEDGDAGQAIEEQIYATITTNSKFSSSSAVGTDTGRSRVVYRGGGVTIYQVDEETVVAKEGGDAGITKRKTEAVTITTTSKFNTTGAVTGATGSSRVVYRGGGVVVYQSDNEFAVLSNTDAGSSVEKNNFATVTTNSVFNTTGTVTGDTGRSRVTYRGGGITVYQVDNESTVANTTGNAGTTIRKTEAVTITTNSNFNTSGAVSGATGSSRVVYRGGGVVVYQSDNESSAISNGDAGGTKDESTYASISTTSTFSGSGNVASKTGRSRVVYRGGGVIAYQVDNEEISPKSGDAGTSIEKNIYATVTTDSVFGTSNAISSSTGRSRIVYNKGDAIVYQVDNESAQPNPDSVEAIDKTAYATITTTSTFSTNNSVSSDTGRSRVVYRGGDITVYQVDTESSALPDVGVVETIDGRPWGEIKTNIEFLASGSITDATGSSRVVYRGGGITVYQVNNNTASLKSGLPDRQIKENRNFGNITRVSKYDTTPTFSGDGEARIVYNDRDFVVYEITELDSVDYNTDVFDTKEERIYGSLTTKVRYDTTIGTLKSDTATSRIVFNGKNSGGSSVKIYEITELAAATHTPKGTLSTGESSGRDWGFLWTETYYSDQDEVASRSVRAGSSRAVFRAGKLSDGGKKTIYEIKKITPVPLGFSIGSGGSVSGNYVEIETAVEEDEHRKLTTKTAYDKKKWTSGQEYDSTALDFVRATQRAVYSDEENQIYRIDIIRGTAVSTAQQPVKFETQSNFRWPRVLEKVHQMVFCLKENDGEVRRMVPIWRRDPYDGPCKAIVKEHWTAAKPETMEVMAGDSSAFNVAMVTNAIQLEWPIFTFKSGPCLHPEVTFTWTTGLNDPDNVDWKDNKEYEQVFPATNLTDWPKKVVVDRDVSRYRDGFGWISRVVEIYPPDDTDLGTKPPLPVSPAPGNC